LVNFPAALRFRRHKRIPPSMVASLGAHAEAVIDASLALYNAVIWKPAAHPTAVDIPNMAGQEDSLVEELFKSHTPMPGIISRVDTACPVLYLSANAHAVLLQISYRSQI
jgi:hypothetical protein